jgi:molybdate transport system substrate-binding protein
MFVRMMNTGLTRAGLAAALLAALLLSGTVQAKTDKQQITLYAAASMSEVLSEAAKAYNERTGTEVRQVYAASSVIARQVAAGAPADLFISANQKWMDYLEERGLLEPGTRRDVARNRLVAVVPLGSPVTAEQGSELGRGWIPQRLAAGETGSVPAGIYAREALTALGRWEALQKSLVVADSVRVALAWVARGEVDAGMVYASDAAATARVRQVWTVPENAHSPISCPAAVLKGRRDALAFLEFLTGEDGKRLFTEHGFLPAGDG